MNLLYNNELAELKIGGRRICLCSTPDNKPDVVYGNENFRISKARVGYTNGDSQQMITELVDVWDVKRQLDSAELSGNRGYGNYSYIDWQYEYVTIALKTNKIKYKMYEAPKLTSDNTELNITVYPNIKNLGMGESGMFESVIASKSGDAEVILFMDVTNPLDSYIL